MRLQPPDLAHADRLAHAFGRLPHIGRRMRRQVRVAAGPVLLEIESLRAANQLRRAEDILRCQLRRKRRAKLVRQAAVLQQANAAANGRQIAGNARHGVILFR